MISTLMAFEFIATVLSIVGAIFVAQKTNRLRKIGFSVWIVSNIAWMAFGYITMTIGVFITFTAYFVFNIWGYHNNKEDL